MQAYLGVNADSGRTRTVRASRGNAAGVSEAGLHGQGSEASGDAGDRGAEARGEVKPEGAAGAGYGIRPGRLMHGLGGSRRSRVASVPE